MESTVNLMVSRDPKDGLCFANCVIDLECGPSDTLEKILFLTVKVPNTEACKSKAVRFLAEIAQIECNNKKIGHVMWLDKLLQ